MIALSIIQVKKFMANLLSDETFDKFYLTKVELGLLNDISIDGRINKEFLVAHDGDNQNANNIVNNNPNSLIGDKTSKTVENDVTVSNSSANFPEYSRWSEVKPIVFQLIKGKTTPKSMDIILHLNNFPLAKDENISAYYLKIKFEDNKLQVITGVSYKTFSMDKTSEREWDEYIGKFMKNYECE